MLGDYVVDLSDYVKKGLIGRGCFAKVFLVQNELEDGKLYAAKVNYNSNNNPEEQKIFMNEIDVLKKTKYPTILKFIGYSIADFELKPYPTSIFEYMPKGSLKELLQNSVDKSAQIVLTETQKYIIILGIAFGMKYLHSQKITHRDLKTSNILLNEFYYPIICDFGFSRITNDLNPNMKSVLGTRFYMAPEIWSGEYRNDIDVYAFSIIVSEIFAGYHRKFTTKNIIGDKNIQFLIRCNSRVPSERPTFDDICKYFVQKDFLLNFPDINSDEVQKFFNWLITNGDPEATSYQDIFFASIGKKCDIKNIDDNDEDFREEDDDCFAFKLSEKTQTAEIVRLKKIESDVIIPSHVTFQSKEYKITRIGNESFRECSINSLKFASDSFVKSIGNSAFAQSSLFRLCIPSSLEILEDNWCSGADHLSHVEISENNRSFSIEKFFLIKNAMKKEIVFSLTQIEDDFHVPSDVVCIRNFALKCQNKLRSITSEGPLLRSIGSYAFYNCSNLQNIFFGKSSSLSFGNFCFAESKILSSAIFACKDVNIGKSCFENCISLSTLQFSDLANLNLSSRALKGCENLASLSAVNAETISIDEECIVGANKLESIMIEAESVALSEKFVMNCALLSEVTIISKDALSITHHTFEGCFSLKKVEIETSASLIIDEYCFAKEVHLDEIKLSGADGSISSTAFEGCLSLKKVSIAFEKVVISSDLFESCKSLEKVKILAKSMAELSSGSFIGKANLISVEISGHEAFIGSSCFQNCSSFENLVFEKVGNLTLATRVFSNCPNFKSADLGVSSNLTICENSFDESSIQTVYMQGKDIRIDKNSFKKLASLTAFNVNSAVNISLGNRAFEGCKNLKKLTLNAVSNLNVGDFCFSDNLSLCSLEISGCEVTTGNCSFANCISIRSIFIENADHVVFKNDSFKGCSSIETVHVNARENFTAGCSCFEKAASLKSVSSGCSVAIFKEKCFENCSSLTFVSLPSASQINYAASSFAGTPKSLKLDFNKNAKIIILQ